MRSAPSTTSRSRLSEAPLRPQRFPTSSERGVPILRQGIAELRALKPPADLEDDFNRMLDETAKTIPAAQSLADAAEKGDAAAVQKAEAQAQAASDSSNQLANDLELDQCAAA